MVSLLRSVQKINPILLRGAIGVRSRFVERGRSVKGPREERTTRHATDKIHYTMR